MKKICLFLMAAMLLLYATAFSQESKSRTKLYETHYNNYRIIHSVISPKGNIIVLTYGGVWYAKDEILPLSVFSISKMITIHIMKAYMKYCFSTPTPF